MQGGYKEIVNLFYLCKEVIRKFPISFTYAKTGGYKDLSNFFYHGLLEIPDVQLPFDAKYRPGGYY